MKKQLLVAAFVLILSITSFSQQWLYFPSGINNNRVDVGNLSITGSSITIEALITLNNSTPLPVAFDIVSKHYSISDCNYLFRPTEFAIRTSSGFISLGNPIHLCLDETYHVAGTYDGDSIKYYINGVQVASQHWTGTLTQNTHTTGIGNMYTNSNYYEQFIGYIDEVRIWNVVRSKVDIAANMYNLSNPTSQTGLVAYYKFEGNFNNIQGNSAFDGVAVGSQILNPTNPLFNGSVSNQFCIPTGIFDNINSSALQIYPNPNSGNFIVDISMLSKKWAHLTINNIIGAKITDLILRSDKTEIKLEEPNGIYFATISTDKGTYTVKILIQR